MGWIFNRTPREPSGQLSSQQARDAEHWRNIERNTREGNAQLGLTPSTGWLPSWLRRS